MRPLHVALETHEVRADTEYVYVSINETFPGVFRYNSGRKFSAPSLREEGFFLKRENRFSCVIVVGTKRPTFKARLIKFFPRIVGLQYA